MADSATPNRAKIGNKNEKIGQVVSAKMTKTIVVEVTRRVAHPVYKRIISKRSKFYAHDEQQSAKIGDTVRIIECRPMSKLKRWRLGEVLRKAVQVAVEPSAVDLETTQPTSGSKSPRNKPARQNAPSKGGSKGGKKS
jgi:small subunit ribosomal protein S17